MDMFSYTTTAFHNSCSRRIFFQARVQGSFFSNYIFVHLSHFRSVEMQDQSPSAPSAISNSEQDEDKWDAYCGVVSLEVCDLLSKISTNFSKKRKGAPSIIVSSALTDLNSLMVFKSNLETILTTSSDQMYNANIQKKPKINHVSKVFLFNSLTRRIIKTLSEVNNIASIITFNLPANNNDKPFNVSLSAIKNLQIDELKIALKNISAIAHN